MGGGPAIASGVGELAHLTDPNRKWYNNRRLILLHFWIFLMLITSMTNGYDGSMMNGLQSLDNWQSYFHNPKSGDLGLLNAIQNIGALAAYPFAPYVTDGVGRRMAILLGAVIMCGATALQTASQSVGMFIGARFMIGFGLTFAANAAPLLVTEVSYPRYRAPLTSTYNSLWYLGSIIAAWTTYGTFRIHSTWSWRVPSALQALPSVLQIAFIFFMPESPRWLVSKGKEQQALDTLAYYHADGNKEDPLVKYEFEEIKAAIAFDRDVASNVGWKSLIATPGNRRRMRIIVAIAFFSQWSGNGLASYYLNVILKDIGITDSDTQLLINGILQIWNLLWALLASGLCDRLGRRLLFLTSAAGMFIFFSAQTICFAYFVEKGTTDPVTGEITGGPPNAAHGVIAFIFLFYAAYDLAFTPLIVSYAVEILPFELRAKGFNVFNFTISAAIIFNQYVNPIALENIGWKYYIVYIVWIAFEFAFLYRYIVETRGKTLEETAALFDGEEATGQLAAATHRVSGHAGRDDASLEKGHGGSISHRSGSVMEDDVAVLEKS